MTSAVKVLDLEVVGTVIEEIGIQGAACGALLLREAVDSIGGVSDILNDGAVSDAYGG